MPSKRIVEVVMPLPKRKKYSQLDNIRDPARGPAPSPSMPAIPPSSNRTPIDPLSIRGDAKREGNDVDRASLKLAEGHRPVISCDTPPRTFNKQPPRPRPSSSTFMSPLQSCLPVTVHKDNIAGRLEVANLEKACTGQDELKGRLLALLKHPGWYPCAINLATTHPALFDTSQQYISTFGLLPETAIFTLTGIVTHNGMNDDVPDRSREICLAPFDVGFSRALAVLRGLGDEGYYYIPSFKRGISIASSHSNFWPGYGADSPPVLARNSAIPVYDGRSKFLWHRHRYLRSLEESSVKVGMVCSVLFSLRFGWNTNHRVNRGLVRKTPIFNIQAVVVLADRNPDACVDVIGQHDIPRSEDVVEDFHLGIGRAVMQPEYKEEEEEE